MRVTQHHITSRSGLKTLIVGGVLAMALTMPGCSTMNMTGFSFPVFGLNSEKAQQSDANTTASIPASTGPGQSQKLISQ